MAEVLNLYQKLAKIRKQVEVVQKNKSGYGYKYVTDDELLAKITVGMDKYGVSLVPNIVPGTLKVEPYTYKKTKREKQKDGNYATYEETVNEFTAVCDMSYVWVNNDNPEETVTVSWSMVGQQSDASQCLGSGLTYSMRYFLLKYFNVATPDDDPDNWRSKQKAIVWQSNKNTASSPRHCASTVSEPACSSQNRSIRRHMKKQRSGFLKKSKPSRKKRISNRSPMCSNASGFVA